MEQAATSVALGIAVRLQNLQSLNKGLMEQRKQARLEKVAEALLEFKTEEETMRWLLVKNKGFSNIAPIDLVESEYATQKLLSVIRMMRSGVFSRKEK